jgi:hypothetical protein
VLRFTFLNWLTARPVLPPNGLQDTEAGRIKLRLDASAELGAYPKASTCEHELTLPDYRDAGALRSKLLEALAQHEKDPKFHAE